MVFANLRHHVFAIGREADESAVSKILAAQYLLFRIGPDQHDPARFDHNLRALFDGRDFAALNGHSIPLRVPTNHGTREIEIDDLRQLGRGGIGWRLFWRLDGGTRLLVRRRRGRFNRGRRRRRLSRKDDSRDRGDRREQADREGFPHGQSSVAEFGEWNWDRASRQPVDCQIAGFRDQLHRHGRGLPWCECR